MVFTAFGVLVAFGVLSVILVVLADAGVEAGFLGAILPTAIRY
jgi:hypothetical protein